MNRVVHFEIQAADPDKLEKFYKELFGWEFQHMGADYMDYRVVMTGPMPKVGEPIKMQDMGINGGLTKRMTGLPTSGAPINGFVNIVGVGDCDAMFKKGLSLGGTEAVAPMDVKGVGRLAYLLDPENNIFGIITPSMENMPK